MKIVTFPHPALRFASRPLTAIDNEVRRVAHEMIDLMHQANGLGLAANQVAWPFRLFVMAPDKEHPERTFVLINPVIMERKGAVEGDEGCLSFPDLFQRVRRAKSVRVQAYNLDGQLIEYATAATPPPLGELTARILQHETDHLDGILFIDKMGTLAKLSARSELRRFEERFRKAQAEGEYPRDAEIEERLKKQAERGPTPPEPPPSPPSTEPEPPRI